MTYKDIFGWFRDEEAASLDRLIKENGAKTVLEIGAFLGRSTAFFAERVDNVVVVDPFIMWEEGRNNGDAVREGGESFFGKFVKNMYECGVSEKVDPYVATSVEIWDTLKGRKFDLVYIDGAHDYKSVLTDLKLYGESASMVICGDDYDENWPGVRDAVNEIFGDRVKVEGRLWYVEISPANIA